MKTPYPLIALCASVMFLGACGKTTPAPPEPMVSQPVPADTAATPVSGANPAVPPAASVFPPTTDAAAGPALGTTDGTRKPKQESETRLLPGQNNDHSAPLSPAR